MTSEISDEDITVWLKQYSKDYLDSLTAEDYLKLARKMIEDFNQKRTNPNGSRS